LTSNELKPWNDGAYRWVEAWGVKVNWRKTIILLLALSAAGTLAAMPWVSAQTFQTYRCADGSQFIVAFYQCRHNARACEAAGDGVRACLKAKGPKRFSFRPFFSA
jgi:hypothetical protein